MLKLLRVLILTPAVLLLGSATSGFPGEDALSAYSYVQPSSHGFTVTLSLPSRVDLRGTTIATVRVDQVSGNPILVWVGRGGPFPVVLFDSAGKRHECDDPDHRNFSGTEPMFLSRPGRHYIEKLNLSHCSVPAGQYRAAVEGNTDNGFFITQFQAITVF